MLARTYYIIPHTTFLLSLCNTFRPRSVLVTENGWRRNLPKQINTLNSKRMKKYMFSFLLAAMAAQFSSAQHLDGLMDELAKVKGAERMVMNREMLGIMDGAADNETSKKAPFRQSLDSIVTVTLENPKKSVRTKFLKKFEAIADGNEYQTLIRVKDEEEYIRFLSFRKGGAIPAVFVLMLDEEDIAIVKMAGELTESDLAGITGGLPKK